MANNRNKEKWINEVLDSTKGMMRAAPRAGLFENLTSKVDSRQQVSVVTLPLKQWAAAAILLLALNIGSVIYFAEHNKNATNTTTGNPIAAEMQSESTYNY